jgi:hypothetical protein
VTVRFNNQLKLALIIARPLAAAAIFVNVLTLHYLRRRREKVEKTGNRKIQKHGTFIANSFFKSATEGNMNFSTA